MKMPHVIPDLIRNPGIKAWIPASAGMTMYFHINNPGQHVMTRKEQINFISMSYEA